MRVFLLVAVFAALAGLAGPACAQEMPHINMLADQPSKTPEQREADQEREKAYQETLKKIPDAKAPSDPWGAVRADAPKAPAKPARKTAVAKSKLKAGSSAN